MSSVWTSSRLPRDKVDYLDRVRAKEALRLKRKVSRAEVLSQALTLLEFFRHDWASETQSIMLLTHELRLGLITRQEAADRIEAQVKAMDEKRRLAVAAQAKGTVTDSGGPADVRTPGGGASPSSDQRAPGGRTRRTPPTTAAATDGSA